MTSDMNRVSSYKTRGSSVLATTMQRIEVTENIRRNTRLTLMFQKRNITAYMSPIDSPVVRKKTVKTLKQDPSIERLQMLKKWQAEKKKKLAEQKAKSKPIFKAGLVHYSNTTDINQTYTQIKGKQLKTANKSDTFKLAPSSTYKFKPPINIKPIELPANKAKPNTRRKLDFKLENISNKKERKQKSVTKMKTKKTEEPKPTTSTDTVNVTIKTSLIRTPTSNNLEKNKLRQTKDTADAIVYVSPFVTLSRGKDKARNEYHQRNSDHHSMSSAHKNTTPKAASKFFEKLLNDQKQRLNQLCEHWKAYEEQEKPPEEACDMIRVAIGQTELLVRKKFSKFIDLIQMCRASNSEKKVTCLDLHGFWDIIMIEINNLDQRFENLSKLQNNNWEEILLTPLIKKKKAVKAKVKKNTSKPEVKSRFRELKEQYKKNNLEAKTTSTDVHPSPGTSLGRHGGLWDISNIATNENSTVTPERTRNVPTPKSILRSEKTKKRRPSVKTVIFVDDMDMENESNSSDLIQFSPVVHTPRRSSRLAQRRNNIP